ncbi:MAG: hypothetical protein ACXVFO_15545 [Solirubrobacteraceae bacterium]
MPTDVLPPDALAAEAGALLALELVLLLMLPHAATTKATPISATAPLIRIRVLFQLPIIIIPSRCLLFHARG